jgi:hypothetical protein
MLRTVLISAVMLFVGGCAFAPPFTPTTMQGAECKRVCAMGQSSCDGNPYTCDNGYKSCIESCIDIDRLSK